MDHIAHTGASSINIVIILLAAAVFIVAVFKRLNLSPVLGYLVAGAFIGEHGLKIVQYEQVHFVGHLGVVFLLFAIGLELSMERLKAMRKYVFGLGLMQVLITSVIIASAIILMTKDNISAVIIAGGLTLSSTAIVLQVLNETNSSQLQIGRIALAILILQDFIVVPLLVITPLLANTAADTSILFVVARSMAKAVAVLIGLFITGRVIFRPLFAFITPDNNEGSEIPIAVTLLIVLAVSTATESLELSSALGAFAAGVLVAETDFRHTAEESIYPFKSLLLGLFFMSVGMKIDVIEIYNQIYTIFTFCVALILLKTLVISALCILFGFNKGTALHAGLLLSQGGEFAFILFGLGKDNHILNEQTANILLLVVTCSMALTPLLAKIGQKIAESIERKAGKSPEKALEVGARDLTNHVIIGGFGKVGNMIAKMLSSENINYIALDVNYDKVKKSVDKGLSVFRGDISQLGNLKAIGADRAATIVLTMQNEITIKKTCKILQESYPHLSVIIKREDFSKATSLYEVGATHIIPEAYEIGLQLGSLALRNAGINENEIIRLKQNIRAGNYVSIKKDDDNEQTEEN